MLEHLEDDDDGHKNLLKHKRKMDFNNANDFRKQNAEIIKEKKENLWKKERRWFELFIRLLCRATWQTNKKIRKKKKDSKSLEEIIDIHKQIKKKDEKINNK